MTRDATMTSFYAAVLLAEPESMSDGTGAQLWRLRDTRDPSKPLEWPLLRQHCCWSVTFTAAFFPQSSGWGRSLQVARSVCAQ